MISSVTQSEINRILRKDMPYDDLTITLKMGQSGSTIKYTARVSGWVYPYDYKHPRRRFLNSRAVSSVSLDKAASEACEHARNPDN